MDLSTVKCILMDIEGTITSIRFVQDTLFPYVKNNLSSYLEQNWGKDETKADVEELKKQAVKDKEDGVDGVVSIEDGDDTRASLEKNVLWNMSLDRKITALKQLQGHIWKVGYEKGDIKGHLYSDVADMLRLWKSGGRRLFIYSSGSVEAQKLLLSNSESGDLLDLIEDHFDTNVGPKVEAESYKIIAGKIGVSPEEILFLTDVAKEAEAANDSGMKVSIVIREGNAPLTEEITKNFHTINSLNDLSIESCAKRAKLSINEEVSKKSEESTETPAKNGSEDEPMDVDSRKAESEESKEAEKTTNDKTEDNISTEKVESMESDEKKNETSSSKETEDNKSSETVENTDSMEVDAKEVSLPKEESKQTDENLTDKTASKETEGDKSTEAVENTKSVESDKENTDTPQKNEEPMEENKTDKTEDSISTEKVENVGSIESDLKKTESTETVDNTKSVETDLKKNEESKEAEPVTADKTDENISTEKVENTSDLEKTEIPKANGESEQTEEETTNKTVSQETDDIKATEKVENSKEDDLKKNEIPLSNDESKKTEETEIVEKSSSSEELKETEVSAADKAVSDDTKENNSNGEISESNNINSNSVDKSNSTDKVNGEIDTEKTAVHVDSKDNGTTEENKENGVLKEKGATEQNGAKLNGKCDEKATNGSATVLVENV